ncbi:MAG: NosD domain-containing protein, partial [Lentisphaerota bacterium]
MVLTAAGLFLWCLALPAAATRYYVNDTNLVGDVYTLDIGLDVNNGTNPCCPKATIQSILSKHDLEPGDTIFVDTGIYVLTNNITLTSEDAGSALAYVVIQGSTNIDFGGTFIDRNAIGTTDFCIHNMGADYVLLADLRLSHGLSGVYFQEASYGMLSNVWIGSAQTYGINLSANSDYNQVINCGITKGNKYGVWNQGVGNRIVNSTIAHNGDSQIWLSSGSIELQNSIVLCGTANKFCIDQGGGTAYAGNFNDLVATNGAIVGKKDSQACPYLLDWQRQSSQDTNSLSHDPLFAQSVSNDYHLCSLTGRYVPGSGWTSDVAQSACIDPGNPGSIWTNEPVPNGGRINLGAYGGTFKASKSLTTGWLLALSFNAGGIVQGNVTLRWRSGLTNGLDTVRLEYARDESNGWEQITSGLLASVEQYDWATTNVLGSPFARWRVVSESDTNVWDATDQTFNLRPFVFYVNDSITSDDQYCTAPGNDLNPGVSSNAPKASVQAILNTYDLDAGDKVYVD